MSIKKDIRSRILLVMDELDITRASLARRSEVSRSSVTQWLHEERPTEPKGKPLERLCNALGVSKEWLKGETNYRGESLRSSHVTRALESDTDGKTTNVFQMFIRDKNRKQLVHYLRDVPLSPIDRSMVNRAGVAVENVVILKLIDDCLYPEYPSGSWVYISALDKTIISNAVYAVFTGETYSARRFFIDEKTQEYYIGTNNRSTAIPITKEEIEQINFIGRIFGVSKLSFNYQD